MLSEEVKAFLNKRFDNLIDPVTLVFRKGKKEIDTDIERLLIEISNASSKISINIQEDLECIDLPCISIESNGKDFGIRFMGKPDKGEFKTFIDTIVMVSRKEYDLSERTEELLKQLDQQVDIKVFITNSCGWCPPAVLKTYSFAMASDFIKATAIDCYIFSDLAVKYNVATVPKIVINEKVEQIGLKDENQLLGNILASVS
ncbi:thioredoxin family protein [Persephonella sp.]